MQAGVTLRGSFVPHAIPAKTCARTCQWPRLSCMLTRHGRVRLSRKHNHERGTHLPHERIFPSCSRSLVSRHNARTGCRSRYGLRLRPRPAEARRRALDRPVAHQPRLPLGGAEPGEGWTGVVAVGHRVRRPRAVRAWACVEHLRWWWRWRWWLFIQCRLR